jgi:hypothetical protein
MLRLLRPLRSIQKIPRIRMLVITLIKSIRGLLDVLGFMFFITSVFAILGIHQFSGAQYNRCRIDLEPTINLDDPLASTWPINFEAKTLCLSDEMCQSQLSHTDTTVFKCGSLEEFQLPLEIDDVTD